MKFVFLLGGACGFAAAAIAGYSAGRQPDHIFLDAALGCLAGALLFRGFWAILLGGIRESFLARRGAAQAAAKTPRTPT